jgi:hypothetical protein
MNSIKKSNPWIEHVKAYQAENNCTYAVALKESKASYKKPSKKEAEAPVEVEDVKVEEAPIKKKRVYRRKKKVPEVVETADKATQTE